LWRFRFEVSLEYGVLFFQLGVPFPLLFAFPLFLAELPPKALVFALQTVNLLSLPFEESGKRWGGSSTRKGVPECRSCGLK